ncbi:DM13 domain-containing protein [Echinicola vietnamensis]|uniref:Electron transfer protein with DM13 domain n=1 Tax=Echinicola vietnamensis (strain DSM 17526 / LMG 23754 / KMM 6221) TaxID=926556 RepID=L0G4N9_ECHVK|nr:DM13 domain-containing protein [Echinicola vietnamensis]AGA79795.1 electron transfer protein with DM13 domain [Echinicola vietnamensis DSM 17526]
MKYSMIYCLLCLVVVSCSMEENEPDTAIEDKMEVQEDQGAVAYSGDFMADAHPTSGLASVHENKVSLNLKDFKTDNGPLLEVYLATDKNATDFISLGELKGVEGDFSYSIPADVDLSKYDHVLIWCVEFSVNFGYAVLEMPVP